MDGRVVIFSLPRFAGKKKPCREKEKETALGFPGRKFPQISRCRSTHLRRRGHFIGEVVVVRVGVLLDEVVVGDVEVEGAAAGNEAVHLRSWGECRGKIVFFFEFRNDSSRFEILREKKKKYRKGNHVRGRRNPKLRGGQKATEQWIADHNVHKEEVTIRVRPSKRVLQRTWRCVLIGVIEERFSSPRRRVDESMCRKKKKKLKAGKHNQRTRGKHE